MGALVLAIGSGRRDGVPAEGPYAIPKLFSSPAHHSILLRVGLFTNQGAGAALQTRAPYWQDATSCRSAAPGQHFRCEAAPTPAACGNISTTHWACPTGGSISS